LFQIGGIDIHILQCNGSPVGATHGAVDDKGQTQPFPIETTQTEEVAAIEQIPRLPPREQRRELASREFVDVHHRDACGLPDADLP